MMIKIKENNEKRRSNGLNLGMVPVAEIVFFFLIGSGSKYFSF